MRSSHVLILVATSLLAICGGAPATEQTTRVASSVVYSNDAIINLSEGKLPYEPWLMQTTKSAPSACREFST
jgi:hypothetical protein